MSLFLKKTNDHRFALQYGEGFAKTFRLRKMIITKKYSSYNAPKKLIIVLLYID